MRGRRVLVTGMGSELGSLVTSRIAATDWAGDIFGFDVDPPRRNIDRARFERIELHETAQIAEMVADFNPHVLVHIAVWEPHARLSESDAREHTEMYAREVFTAAHQADALESVVVRSGIEIYGSNSHAPKIATEETPIAPNTTYGHMVHEIEKQASDLHIARGINVCTLRLAPVLGAHVPSPLGRLLRLPAIPYHGLGNPIFSVVEDRDAADAFVSAAERSANGTINIVANGAISMLRAARAGSRLPIPTFGPGWLLARTLSNVAGAPVPDHVADLLHKGRLAASNEAAHVLRFAPRYSTTEVIEHLYEWPQIERIPARRQVA